MPEGYKQATPFSNGSEADFFEETFCMRCAKCKLDELSMLPSARTCPTYRATARAYIDIKFWPTEGSIMVDPKGRRVCVDFFCIDPEVMEAYEKEFPQTYVGYTLKNEDKSFLALNPDGSPALRCGTKKNLEGMLLVINADKVQSVVASFPENNASTEEKHG